MAFAPPGVDEVEVLTWLITTVYHLVMTRIELPRPVLLACHVGITRIEGDGLGGAAALRAQALLSHPDVRAIAAGSSSPLIVIMPDSLYAELRAEGLPGSDWIPVPTACAWVQCYPAQPLTGMDDLIYT